MLRVVKHARPRPSLDARLLSGAGAWRAPVALGVLLALAGVVAVATAVLLPTVPVGLRLVVAVAGAWGVAVGGVAVRSGVAARQG